MKYPGVKTFFKLIFFIISSWLLIHFFGLFGVFLAIAYPIWWFFVPRQIPCLYCQTHKDQEWCPLCHKTVNKANGTSPESIKSAFLNSFLILLISVLSLGFIFVESQILTRMGVVTTNKTATFEIPAGGERKVGESFPMEINLNDLQTTINAFQADLRFDPTIVEAVEITTKDSFATISVQKEINNELGYIRFSGGLPNPGHKGPEAYVGTVYFKGKSPGVTDVKFLPSSMVLANDGKGTNVLKDFAKASYIIVPAEPDDIFPDISMVFEDVSNINEAKTMDFTVDGKVLGTADSINPNVIEENLSLNPFMLIGTLDRIILSLWQFQ